MGFHVRRSIKLLPSIRLSFGAAPSGVRRLPGSGSSFTHLDKQRRERLVVLHPSLDSGALPARDWRGLLWIALIVFAIAVTAAQAMK